MLAIAARIDIASRFGIDITEVDSIDDRRVNAVVAVVKADALRKSAA
jgi:hypothetical protein